MQHVIKKNAKPINHSIRSLDATILERLSLLSEHSETKPIHAAVLLSLTDELLQKLVENGNADQN